MAKVLISIPDTLLERVDAYAEASGETRSGFLQRLAERELERADRQMDEEVGRLLDSIKIIAPEGHPAGNDAAKLIREDRESH